MAELRFSGDMLYAAAGLLQSAGGAFASSAQMFTRAEYGAGEVETAAGIFLSTLRSVSARVGERADATSDRAEETQVDFETLDSAIGDAATGWGAER